jgi:hypothetical protein
MLVPLATREISSLHRGEKKEVLTPRKQHRVLANYIQLVLIAQDIFPADRNHHILLLPLPFSLANATPYAPPNRPELDRLHPRGSEVQKPALCWFARLPTRSQIRPGLRLRAGRPEWPSQPAEEQLHFPGQLRSLPILRQPHPVRGNSLYRPSLLVPISAPLPVRPVNCFATYPAFSRGAQEKLPSERSCCGGDEGGGGGEGDGNGRLGDQEAMWLMLWDCEEG